MIAATDLKKGMVIELEGQLYSILDFQHIKMGGGSAQIRVKMQDIQAGQTTRAQLPGNGEIQSGSA